MNHRNEAGFARRASFRGDGAASSDRLLKERRLVSAVLKSGALRWWGFQNHADLGDGRIRIEICARYWAVCGTGISSSNFSSTA